VKRPRLGHIPVMSKVIISDSAIMSGRPVFRGTRVPVDMIFECLADGMSIDDILDGWPSVRREDLQQAILDAGREIKTAA
jgi:uncharacterized protein (DUF433 family)